VSALRLAPANRVGNALRHILAFGAQREIHRREPQLVAQRRVGPLAIISGVLPLGDAASI